MVDGHECGFVEADGFFERHNPVGGQFQLGLEHGVVELAGAAVVEQQDGAAGATPMGIGNEQVEIGVIVDIDCLTVRAAQPGELIRRLLVANKRKATFVQEKVELLAAKAEQVLPPVLVHVGQSCADDLLNVEATGFGIQ